MCTNEIKSTVCMFLIISALQSSYGLKLINFNEFQRHEDDNFKSFLKNTINTVPEVIKLNRIEEHPVKDEYKVVVRKIVPHKKPFTIEYDGKLNTIYIPLVRLHKSRVRKNPNILIFNEETKNIKNKIKSLNVFKMLRGSEKKKLQKQVNELTDKLDKRLETLKNYNTLVYILKDILRAPQFEKSGEENDPLAPGKSPLGEGETLPTEKAKVWIPHYPPWNYWTYKKTIHQDPCPGNQVKMGNMCVWVPPH